MFETENEAGVKLNLSLICYEKSFKSILKRVKFYKKKKIVKKVKRQELTKYTHRSKEILNALKNHVMISSDF